MRSHRTMPDRSRSVRRRRAPVAQITAAAALCFVALPACRRDATEQAPAVSATTPAPDQVSSTDVVESREDLFGLPLPMGMRVTERMQFQAKAIGNLPFEQVANYVRDHVDAKNVETGPSSTVFEAARVKKPRVPPGGKPSPNLVMRVVVKKNIHQTEVGVWADEIVPDDAPYVEQPPRPSEEVAPDPVETASP